MRAARIAVAGVLLSIATVAYAERLPIQTFTMTDGLPNERVKCMFRDSRGLMWVCTAAGIDWFDGQRFSGHALDELLGSSTNDVIEAPDHTYWIATNGRGVLHLDSAGKHVTAWPPNRTGTGGAARIRQYAVGTSIVTNRVNTVFRDRAGTLWAGSDDGVFRLDAGDRFAAVALPVPPGRHVQIWRFAETADGSLWIGTAAGLYRRSADGAIARVELPSMPGAVVSFAVADDGALWIGHTGGVLRAVVARGIAAAMPMGITPAPGPAWLYRGMDRSIWIGYSNGPLLRYDGRGYERFSAAQGLPEAGVRHIAEDAEANLWISDGIAGGAVRILKNGFRTYGRADGLRNDLVNMLVETTRGEVCAISGADSNPGLDCFDGGRFIDVRPHLPEAAVGWERRRHVLEARDGSWWFATTHGLYRFAPVRRVADLAGAAPADTYTSRDGLPSDSPAGIFEDSHGDIWAWGDARDARDGYTIVRWRHDTSRIVEVPGLTRTNQVFELGEDARGDIWIGFRDGGLARWREGRLRIFGAADGIDAPWVGVLYRDTRDRLWVGTGGLYPALIVDDASSDHPRFTPYRYPQGSPAPAVAGCFVEDAWRNMYFCTGYGIERADMQRHWSARFDKADGLLDEQMWAGIAARDGTLWFGTARGLARLAPAKLDPPQPPLTRIHALRIGEAPYPLSVLGETSIPEFSVPLGYSPIQIQYASVASNVQFQYRMGGVDRSWQTTNDSSITFANLSPGFYRFEVRAIRRRGGLLGAPASVSFTVVPPFWKRGWFFGIVAFSLVGVGYTAHRYRVARIIEVERIRTRIATDLHDDIGASLSQIAILSEVASRRVQPAAMDVADALHSIGRTAGELVDSMSDIVWAINPKHDALLDLSGRMRRFGSDVLSGRNIGFRFDAPEPDAHLHLSAELRREVYLTFKEGLRNVVRHSGATEVWAGFHVSAGMLELTLHDNGAGFDPRQASGGHGLVNLRRRAEALHGMLDIESAPGRGTAIVLRLPLRSRAGRFMFPHGS